MTLQFLLASICFTAYPFAGMVLAGNEAGVVGNMIGMGVGLVAGGLAYYALKKTVYSDEWEERLKSQPQAVQAPIEKGTGFWIVFLLVAALLMVSLLPKFIVQQMAG